MTAMTTSIRPNGKTAEAAYTVHDKFAPPVPVIGYSWGAVAAIDDVAGQFHSQIGIDWRAVLAALLADADPTGDPLHPLHCLGRVEALLPSRRWYTMAHVGAEVGSDDVARDLEYMRKLYGEARRMGLEVCFDEMGECLFVQANLKPSLALPGGTYVFDDADLGLA